MISLWIGVSRIVHMWKSFNSHHPAGYEMLAGRGCHSSTLAILAFYASLLLLFLK